MNRAAERLHVSQSTMSKQLKELENELGSKLFVRSNYSIKLTDTGMLLKKRAEDILALVEKTEVEFRSMEEIDSKELPLICSRQWLDESFPHWFGEDSATVNIAATYNLAFNGAVMARAGIGYAVVIDKLIDTGESSDLTFRPLTDVPGTGLYVIWRKYQTFTPASQLLIDELEKRFRSNNTSEKSRA